MKFSAFAGTAIVPLLARLVLCAAFLPAGYVKLFSSTTFEGEDARILSELNVGTPLPPDSAGTAAAAGPLIRPASLQEPQGAGEAGTSPDTAAPPPEPAPSDAEPAPTDDEPAAIGPIEAKSVHGVTVMLVKAGWKPAWKPQYLGWVAGLTELIGGLLILLGLFSRVWGLGLAVTMGVAYYLTSWPAPFDPHLFKLVEDPAASSRFIVQSGLFVLALGVLLTGPGPVSLDRLFFHGGRRDDLADDDEG